MRRSLGPGALAAIVTAGVSFAVAASPPLRSGPPSEAASARSSLLHRAVIYAKEGSSKLIDGRWNLGQSETKLGVKLSAAETQQLMACTGQIVCKMPDVRTEDEDRVGVRFTASAASVLRPDLLVTAKHVFFTGKTPVVPFGACSFRSHAGKSAIPVTVEQDQRKGYVFNNEDFMVLRLKRPLEGCDALAIDHYDAHLAEEEELLSVTARQHRTLNKLSSREPVVARGKVRKSLDGVLGGPPFYYTDIDFDLGGSGGAVFALTDGRPEADDQGRLIVRGIAVAYGPRARNGRLYSDEQNYTIVIGLQAEFRELVMGKAQTPEPVEPEPCPEGGAPKIEVIAVPVTGTGAHAPSPRTELSGKLELAAAPRAKPRPVQRKRSPQAPAKPKPVKKEQFEFTLKNATACRICLTYNHCNTYGCWDEAARLNPKSSLSAGVGERAPRIENPQFCKSGQVAFMAAKAKAAREGVHALSAEDIRGLSLEEIKQLRGY